MRSQSSGKDACKILSIPVSWAALSRRSDGPVVRTVQCSVLGLSRPIVIDFFLLGSQAFAFSGIKEIVLPKNLSELKNIFYGCTSLTSITIPSNIELIEADAFAETTLESAIFEDTENWRIYSSSGIEIQNIDYTLLADAKIAADWLTRIHISRVWKNTTQD